MIKELLTWMGNLSWQATGRCSRGLRSSHAALRALPRRLSCPVRQYIDRERLYVTPVKVCTPADDQACSRAIRIWCRSRQRCKRQRAQRVRLTWQQASMTSVPFHGAARSAGCMKVRVQFTLLQHDVAYVSVLAHKVLDLLQLDFEIDVANVHLYIRVNCIKVTERRALHS